MSVCSIGRKREKPFLVSNARKLSLFFGLFLFFACRCGGADVQVYFSPNGGATDAIVQEINCAKHEVLVQAYEFTSLPIANALCAAKARGLRVEAILDRRDLRAGHEAVSLLETSSIPILVDQTVRIAHSKIMIIDEKEIITGSFNFTNAAERYNSENLLILKNDPSLLLKYLKNYQQRHDQSRVLSGKSIQP
jgi:phosphatidylserine/phosphatidylglycerophosphate/cardiolipin synthase-like enzyme